MTLTSATPETAAQTIRGIECRHLLLALPLHALTVASMHDPNGLAGARGFLPGSALVLLGIYAAAAVLYAGWIFRARREPGLLCRGIVALCPAPVYMMSFPADWGMSVVGLILCLMVAHVLLPSGVQTLSSPGADDDGQHAVLREEDRLMALSGLATVAVVLMLCGHGLADGSPASLLAGLAAIVLGLGMTLPLEFSRFAPSWRRGPHAEHLLLAVAGGLACSPAYQEGALWLLALRQCVVVLRLWRRGGGASRLWTSLTQRPAHLLALSFACVIGMGTVLLALPVSAPPDQPLSLLDALFTATSATCVTGLIVVDTATDLSAAGQTIVGILIQVGGLGIMTISVFIALILGRRMGLRSEFAVGEMVGEEQARTALRLLRFIVTATLALEATGAVVLFALFRHGGTPRGRSLALGVFHSVSAFCNAGFSLFSDSLVTASDQPAVPLVVSALVVIGGLGFGVLFTAFTFRRDRPAHISTHVKLVLAASVVLALGGTVLIWFFERDGLFAGLSGPRQCLHAWFQSMTTRTAGFNTVDLRAFGAASQGLMIALMFIGAAPGSTGGGIKVTTIAVLLLLLRSALTGHEHVVAFGRRIGAHTVTNAAVVLCLGGLATFAATIVLLATQPHPAGELLFEAVSAFATVGLSLGVTSDLTPIGKLTIIMLMFIGRVGPLTLLVMMRPRRRPMVDYPTAKVMIG